jgi:hypothetical protein
MRKMFTKSASVLAASLLLLAGAASHVHAHATNLWCYIEKGKVYVEGTFMGGKAVQKGQVVVVNEKGDKVLEGVTDKDGKYSFAPPYQGKMTILLRVDKAHDADFELTEQDFNDAAAEEAKAAGAAAKPEK